VGTFYQCGYPIVIYIFYKKKASTTAMLLPMANSILMNLEGTDQDLKFSKGLLLSIAYSCSGIFKK
jgi:hypothetical protein